MQQVNKDDLYRDIVINTIKYFKRIKDCCVRPIFYSGPIGFSITGNMDTELIMINGKYTPLDRRGIILREYTVSWLNLKISQGDIAAIELLKLYTECYNYGIAAELKLTNNVKKRIMENQINKKIIEM